jgi:ribonuclease III
VKSSIDANALAPLEERLGHRFADRQLLTLALSHASLGAESNERLEFLGDRVLGLIIAEKLVAEHPLEHEGELTVRLHALARRETCAKAARLAGLAPYIVMANSESESGGREKTVILAGACEAMIAALYLDGGMAPAKHFVLQYWADEFGNTGSGLRDAKTVLQEWAQSGVLPDKPQPKYRVKQRVGPDHAPLFSIEVELPGHAPEVGEGPSKREAEQVAARRMLVKLGVWQ